MESGFFIDPYYWDVVSGGPKRDELIEDLIGQIRDMARAGVSILGYSWMPLGPIRTEPITIRGDASATAFNEKSKNLELAGKIQLKYSILMIFQLMISCTLLVTCYGKTSNTGSKQ